MEIGIALTMRVADHVDRYTIDEDGEVGAVVRVEPTEKNLVGFAAAVMLADNQSRCQPQNIAGRIRWTQLQVFLPTCLLSGSRGWLLAPDINLLGLC